MKQMRNVFGTARKQIAHARTRSLPLSRGLGRVVMVLGVTTFCVSQGCTAPRATDSLLAAAEQAVRVNLRADEELSAALLKHSQDQQKALNDAFLADFQHLAERNEGQIDIKDLVRGKGLYDRKLSAILTSRDAVQRLFMSKQRTQMAALDLIAKARRLTAGQVKVLEELEKTQQEVAGLLQTAFPSLFVPSPTASGREGGDNP